MIRNVQFYGGRPSPHPGGHEVRVGFAPDGTVHVQPWTDQPRALADRLMWFAQWLLNDSRLADAIADVPGARVEVFGEIINNDPPEPAEPAKCPRCGAAEGA
jgi:hypothetical protein